MLAKQFRLKKRKSFAYIHRKGKHIGNEVLSISFVYARMRDTPIKIGFSASKKVGNSVVRHRAMRLMRHAVKELLPQIKPDHSIVFTAKPGLTEKHFTEIVDAMRNTLGRGGLLK